MQRLESPPFWIVREALYQRLATHPSTSAYTLADESAPATMPYLILGPIYKGAGGTDVFSGGAVVVAQIEAYATSAQGGTKTVCDMIEAVYDALEGDLDMERHDPPAITVEADVLTASIQDRVGGDLYAQRLVRFQLTMYT